MLFIVLGTGIGLFIPSLNELVMWLVSALLGGYTASNVLKWYWWRFSGMGYFAGMVTGIIAAVPLMFIDVSPLNAFPFLFGACLLACVVGSLASGPDDMEVLKKFYIKTRPWGWWGPVLAELQKDDPNFQGNKDFAKDCINVLVGLTWHTTLTAAPIFLVIKNWTWLGITGVIAIACTVFLKFNWWDKLEDSAAEHVKPTSS